MRYIGCKTNLLENINQVVEENCNDGSKVFCDIFSGTGSVSRFFKDKYQIISNDLLYFSYLLTSATIENNKVPKFDKLKKKGIADPIEYLETSPIERMLINGFITEEYSPLGNANRMYLTEENAVRIDYIRETIENWKSKKLIDIYEYKYLLACLIEGVPFVSNITGTYGAYLKHWDKRAFKTFEMVKLAVVDNGHNNICYNENANELIRKINGDILYIDPPYNSRQYLPNYHVLETIAKYDSPTLKGVTGVRPYENERSEYCTKKTVKTAFEELIKNAKFRHIIISYSDDGLLEIEELIDILQEYCIVDSIKKYTIPYARYKGKLPQNKKEHNEYVLYARKDVKLSSDSIDRKVKNAKLHDAKRIIKSPMNYIGGKYKLLPQLLGLFPKEIDTFVDLFAGGFNVTANVNANKFICNDLNCKVVEMVRTLCYADIDVVLRRVQSKIQEYELSKENENGFKQFREFYNATGNPIDLFTLSCFSFNYQFRFNNNMEYNNPFGRNRSQFSETTKTNLMIFIETMKSKNIEFYTRDFREISGEKLGAQDFIYCDPPYLITNGSYNDGNRGFKDWGENEERALYEYLDSANERGVKFALSNVTEHKGVQNDILLEWASKYNVHQVNSNYSNCSYQLKTKSEVTKEVLVTNY
ncbi:MAG: Dam family site-specific DNA-(adenine-N6)-methyltransferase [Bacillota bacterium]